MNYMALADYTVWDHLVAVFALMLMVSLPIVMILGVAAFFRRVVE